MDGTHPTHRVQTQFRVLTPDCTAPHKVSPVPTNPPRDPRSDDDHDLLPQ